MRLKASLIQEEVIMNDIIYIIMSFIFDEFNYRVDWV